MTHQFITQNEILGRHAFLYFVFRFSSLFFLCSFFVICLVPIPTTPPPHSHILTFPHTYAPLTWLFTVSWTFDLVANAFIVKKSEARPKGAANIIFLLFSIFFFFIILRRAMRKVFASESASISTPHAHHISLDAHCTSHLYLRSLTQTRSCLFVFGGKKNKKTRRNMRVCHISLSLVLSIYTIAMSTFSDSTVGYLCF